MPSGRVAGMDLGRVVATLAVIGVHLSGWLVDGRLRSAPASVWASGIVVSVATHVGVPIFIMISGALNLAPKDESATDFYKRRWSRIGVPLLVWTVVYYFYSTRGLGPYNQTIGATDFIRLQVLGTSTYAHLYFLWLIAGLYLLTPYLRVFVAAADRRQLGGLVLLSVIGVSAHLAFLSIGKAAAQPSAVSLGVQALGYYLLGYYLRDVHLSRAGSRAALGVFGCAVGVEILLAWRLPVYGLNALNDYMLGIWGPVAVIASASLLMWLTNVEEWMAASQTRALAAVRWAVPFTFGVYLVHPILVTSAYLSQYGPLHLKYPVPWMLGLFAYVAAASFAIVWVASRWSLGRLVFGVPEGAVQPAQQTSVAIPESD